MPPHREPLRDSGWFRPSGSWWSPRPRWRSCSIVSGSPRAAVAASLDSTAVVVKLLGGKFELATQSGRVTVLTLIGEDVWALLALSYVSARGDEAAGIGGIAATLAGAALLGLACVLLAKHLLAPVMARPSSRSTSWSVRGAGAACGSSPRSTRPGRSARS